MHIEQLLNSPAVRILRAEHTEFTLDVLYRVLKRPERSTVSQSTFLGALNTLLEEARGADPDRSPGSAEYYLDRWCSEESRFLSRYYESDGDEPVVEISRSADA